jgi:Domain of unknown function (DUF4468) with TBP-like fold
MKKLIIIIFCTLLLSLVSFCQYTFIRPDTDTFISTDTTFERQSENWVFTNVIYVDSTISKDKLFQTAKQWFSETFVSSKNVIDNADKDEGVIYGHGAISNINTRYGYVEFCDINFNIEIRAKDGKIKYILNDFKISGVIYPVGYNITSSSVPSQTFNIKLYKNLPEGLNRYSLMGGKREEKYQNIREMSKKLVDNLIQSLKSSLSKESIKEKDKW